MSSCLSKINLKRIGSCGHFLSVHLARRDYIEMAYCCDGLSFENYIGDSWMYAVLAVHGPVRPVKTVCLQNVYRLRQEMCKVVFNIYMTISLLYE